MTLDKVKIYLDGKMVVFATETDVLIASVPPGQFRIKPTDGDGDSSESNLLTGMDSLLKT
jgi:hypothetical protein